MKGLQTTEHPNAKPLLASISSELKIIQPQFYFPGFDIVADDSCFSTNTILDSKYKIIKINYQIDKIIETIDDVNSELCISENTQAADTNLEAEPENTQAEDTNLEADSDEWTDCSSESNDSSNTTEDESIISEYDLLANNTLDIPDEDCTIEQIKQHNLIAEQTQFFEQIRKVDKLDNTDNCFNVMAILQKCHANTIKTYHQKIFCKRAPLIEPLKAIDPNVYPELFQEMANGAIKNNLLPDPNTKQIFDKLNSIHNTSHVETLALYTLGNLTERGKCPTFPYYFGSVQGLTPAYYHNITDEIQDYSNYDWFCELLEEEKIDVLYIDISAYANSGLQILRSEDINDNLNIDNLNSDNLNSYSGNFTAPDEKEINPTPEIIANMITEFETLMDDSDVEQFVLTGKLNDVNDVKPKDDLLKSKPSDKIIEFEDLAEVDIDKLNPGDILPETKFEHKLFYLKLKNYPVSLSFMEKMQGSLDDSMNSPRSMTEPEILSVLFQVAFGLAVANKAYRFVHNDLHAGNIMFQSTPQKYLYYSIHGNYYRIPTYNKIAKIIDFARATMYINDKWVVSDAFEPNNDAGEQYAMPNADGKYDKKMFDERGNKLPLPNPSFDLALLSTILTHYVVDNIPNSTELVNMLNGWATDKYGINHVHSEVDFSLYTNIARDCHNAVPKEVLKHSIFQQFKIPHKQIPKKQYIYKF